jgi:hypothetical protein
MAICDTGYCIDPNCPRCGAHSKEFMRHLYTTASTDQETSMYRDAAGIGYMEGEEAFDRRLEEYRLTGRW